MNPPSTLFASRWGFILAAMGSAVGLGNIWRFTFMAGENGGGVFIFFYFVFILAFGIPCLIAMITIGRRGRKSPPGSTKALALAEGRSSAWQGLGWLAITIAFLALTFFSVVAGWVLAYIPKALAGAFDQITPAESIALFAGAKADVWAMTLWHGLFMVLTMVIVGRGVREGVERAVTWLIPALFCILILLVVYAAATGAFAEALSFLFAPDFTKVSESVVLLALGQAFFSLSVGGGGILAYGAYLQREASIPKSAFAIAAANVSVDMLAGLAIFPIVFAYGLAPGSGPGLLFETLPVAFGQMPGGQVIGTLFLLLVLFAALSTSISMLESVVARLVEFNTWSRAKMTLLAGGIVWVLGLGSVFSFNVWSDFTPFGFIPMLEGATIFRIVDFFVVNNLILISAFLLCVFVGWVMSEQALRDELDIEKQLWFPIWRIVMRYVAPIAICVISIMSVIDQAK